MYKKQIFVIHLRYCVCTSNSNTAVRYYANVEKADTAMSECWPDIFVTMLGVSPSCCNRFQRPSMRFICITVATHAPCTIESHYCGTVCVDGISTYGSWRTYGNWSCTGGRWHEDALNVKARTRWTARMHRLSLSSACTLGWCTPRKELLHLAFIETFPVKLE